MHKLNDPRQHPSIQAFEPLTAAEIALLRASQSGEDVQIGGQVPQAATEQNRVRPALLRILAVDSGPDLAPHQRGIRIIGAWIDGPLDLDMCDVPRWLALRFCHIPIIRARHARVKGLDLTGSKIIGGISADGLTCLSGLFLSEIYSFAPIRLISSDIAANIYLDGAILGESESMSFIADGIKIGGDITFSNNFHGAGEVRLCQSIIEGLAIFDRVNLQGDKSSLNLEGASCKRGISMKEISADSDINLRGISSQSGIYISGSIRSETGSTLDVSFATCSHLTIEDFSLSGKINLLSVKIETSLSLFNVSLNDKSSIILNTCSIGGNLSIIESCINGTINLMSSYIGGQFLISRTIIIAQYAIVMDGTKTRRGIRIDDQSAINGEARFVNTQSQNDVTFLDSEFHSGTERSISLDAAIIEGRLHFHNCRVHNNIALMGSKIRLDASFDNVIIESNTDDALGIVDKGQPEHC